MDITNNDLVEFELYLTRLGRRKNTIKSHLGLIKRIIQSVTPFNRQNFNLFLLSQIKKGLKASYVNDYIDTINVYSRFKDINEFDDIQYFKEEEFCKATLSDEEINNILNLESPCKGNKYTKNWNIYTLFMTILAYSGMRPGEVSHLTISSVDFGRNVFILNQTKTRPRLVPIQPKILPLLKEHISNINTEFLFPAKNGGQTRQGGTINDVDWGYNFRKRLNMLGIKRENLSIYSLRHSFITRMLEEDVNIFKVQQIVGHSQLSTTAHYTHLTNKPLQIAIKKDRLARKDLPKNEVIQNVANSIKSFCLEEDIRFTFKLEQTDKGLSFNLLAKEYN